MAAVIAARRPRLRAARRASYAAILIQFLPAPRAALSRAQHVRGARTLADRRCAPQCGLDRAIYFAPPRVGRVCCLLVWGLHTRRSTSQAGGGRCVCIAGAPIRTGRPPGAWPADTLSAVQRACTACAVGDNDPERLQSVCTHSQPATPFVGFCSPPLREPSDTIAGTLASSAGVVYACKQRKQLALAGGGGRSGRC